MDNRVLPKKFFKNNPLLGISAASIAYSSMILHFTPEATQAITEELYKTCSEERRSNIEKEKKIIDELRTAEEIINFMRKQYEIINQSRLCEKVLTMQESVIPLILQRYRTTLQDTFVETSIRILVHGDLRYVESLLEMYDQIRNPYAQSMACLVIGMRKIERAAPLLLQEYERMKQVYPEESLCQGPLLGLYAMYDQM